VFLALGCLDLMGDVSVDHTEMAVLPNKGAECTDAEAAAGTCVVRCDAGTPRCSEGLLQRCNDQGDGWVLIDQCASQALCDTSAEACAPPACAPREYRCTETGELQVCNADRSDFEHVEQCLSAAFCSAVPGRAQCDGSPCRAGRQRCNGPQIEQCREDRSGFDPLGITCASAALCHEGEALFPTCAAPVCTPGSFVCEGATLSRCSDDADRYITINDCGTAEACLATEQRCAGAGCTAGVQRCTGAVLERCNAAGSAYETVDTCATAALCDATAAACLVAPPPPDPLPDPTVLDGAAYTLVNTTSDALLGLGPLRLRLPAEWTDIVQTPWTNAAGAAIGPRFIASTGAARFARSFDIPGVSFSATDQAPIDVAQRQAEFDLSAHCTKGTSEPYDDDLYAGTAQTWTNCGVTKATTSVVVAIDKAAGRFVTVVIVTMTAERDDRARQAIWDSFEVRTN
jgi:hypothetical protein